MHAYDNILEAERVGASEEEPFLGTTMENVKAFGGLRVLCSNITNEAKI